MWDLLGLILGTCERELCLGKGWVGFSIHLGGWFWLTPPLFAAHSLLLNPLELFLSSAWQVNLIFFND